MLLNTNNTEVIKLYASIATHSAMMLHAAQEGDWDGLCEAEEQCSKLIGQLQAIKQKSVSLLSEEERMEHIGYLKKILADDAAIRNITEPRLRQLEEFLRAATNSAKLSNSYGTN